MGQLNIKDEALIAEAKALAELLGTSATDAVRRRCTSGWSGSGVERDEASAAEVRGDHGDCRARLEARPARSSPATMPSSTTRTACRSDPRHLGASWPSCSGSRRRRAFDRLLADCRTPRSRAATLVEAAMVSEGRAGPAAAARLEALIAEADIEIVPFTAEHAALAARRLAPLRQGPPPRGTQSRRLLRLCPGQVAQRAAAVQGRRFFQDRHKGRALAHARIADRALLRGNPGAHAGAGGGGRCARRC